MPRELFSDLPADSSALACIVADSSQPEKTRSYALERLVPAIEAIAGQVATGFQRCLRDDLVAESRTIIWLRVHQFNPSAGRFEDWCRTVLYHYAVDLWRKAKSGVVKPAVGGDDSEAMMDLAVTVDTGEESDEAMERCRELRAVLDRIAWVPSRGVHYFSVLLLQLRLVVARRLTQDHLGETGPAARTRHAQRSARSARPENVRPRPPDSRAAGGGLVPTPASVLPCIQAGSPVREAVPPSQSKHVRKIDPKRLRPSERRPAAPEPVQVRGLARAAAALWAG